ncbi:MAG: FAD-dependent thymidylate synthase [Actinobacteria bacterium]|nr:FAD-dependent thymidylate synthase [Actinomycetota bacterium]
MAVTTDVIPDHSIAVLDHGFVRLDAAMADDLSVVNGARVSFARRREQLDEADEGLIRFLMRDRHGTPFEHNAFRFHIRCPIFVAREWFRHRIGSFNEFSMRYAKATEDFYIPEPEDVRSQVGKPGSYSFEPVDPELAEHTREELQAVYDSAYATYTRLVEQGVARELARSVLPVGAYTEFYWTVNARALMNFVSLRAAAETRPGLIPQKTASRPGARTSGTSDSGCFGPSVDLLFEEGAQHLAGDGGLGAGAARLDHPDDSDGVVAPPAVAPGVALGLAQRS